MFEAPDDGWM